MRTEETDRYLAGIEMSIDLNDDLVIFIRCLFPGDHNLGCCQVLQLIDLETTIENVKTFWPQDAAEDTFSKRS